MGFQTLPPNFGSSCNSNRMRSVYFCKCLQKLIAKIRIERYFGNPKLKIVSEKLFCKETFESFPVHLLHDGEWRWLRLQQRQQWRQVVSRWRLRCRRRRFEIFSQWHGRSEVDHLSVFFDAFSARLPHLPAAEHRAEQSSHLSLPLPRIHPIRAQQLLAGQSYHHSATIPGMSEVAYGSSFLILDKLIDPFFYQTQEGGSNDNCLWNMPLSPQLFSPR